MWQSIPDSRVQQFPDGTIVQRNKIPDYAFDDLGDCIDTWKVWERKSLLPFDGTWRDQPWHVWNMLNIFDVIYIAHTNAQAEMDALARSAKRGSR